MKKTPPSGLGIWSAFGLQGKSAAHHVDLLVSIGAGWFAPRADLLTRMPDLVNLCHKSAIQVFPWRYVTPNSAGMNDVASYRALVVGMDCDGIILDAEIEWDKDPAASYRALSFGERLRAALPDTWIADAPWPWIASHPGYPTAAFAEFCDARLPQAYWTEIGVSVAVCLERTSREWDAWERKNPSLVRPVYPIGVTYSRPGHDVSMTEVNAFLDAEPGASLYSLEAASPLVLAGLIKRAARLSQFPPPEGWQPVSPAHALGDADLAERQAADTETDMRPVTDDEKIT